LTVGPSNRDSNTSQIRVFGGQAARGFGLGVCGISDASCGGGAGARPAKDLDNFSGLVAALLDGSGDPGRAAAGVDAGVNADTDSLLLDGGETAGETTSKCVDGVSSAGSSNLVAIELDGDVSSSEKGETVGGIAEAETSGSNGFGSQIGVVPSVCSCNTDNCGEGENG